MTSEPYRLLVERSPDGILISQAGLLCLPTRPRPDSAVWRTQNTLLGRPLLTDLLHSDGHVSLRERLDGVVAGLRVAPFEQRISWADGGIRTSRWRSRASTI